MDLDAIELEIRKCEEEQEVIAWGDDEARYKTA